MSDTRLIDYIKNLNLKSTTLYSDNEYIIDYTYSIVIEFSINVFFIDRKCEYHKNRYTLIPDLKTLKYIYNIKTGKDIEALMRKEKLKQLELCSNQETE